MISFYKLHSNHKKLGANTQPCEHIHSGYNSVDCIQYIRADGSLRKYKEWLRATGIWPPYESKTRSTPTDDVLCNTTWCTSFALYKHRFLQPH